MISEILAATVESAINALLIVGQCSLCISALIFDSITLNFNSFSFSSTSTCVANLGPSRTIKEKDLCNDYYIYYNTQTISTLLVDDYITSFAAMYSPRLLLILWMLVKSLCNCDAISVYSDDFCKLCNDCLIVHQCLVDFRANSALHFGFDF